MSGTTWLSTVAGPVIQRMVPSAAEPASRSMWSAMAATSTGGVGAISVAMESPTWVRIVVPWWLTARSRRRGPRMFR